ncbi:hypothetical protein [Nocardia cyriacigeorgica]|uniref:hypothetical protein n=1 Tax=Nocardia cyriacigeorgica TaxID=135487 RepID=UPI0018957F62|nr:hypothetical protein [Nocardia cyriacigeorgica]MBF6323549.1 hypothetical protein [Nocardia cyriacigeorgica]
MTAGCSNAPATSSSWCAKPAAPNRNWPTSTSARTLGDRTRVEVFSSWPDATLRPGLDIATATDIYAALCNIDVYTTCTVERGWSPERVERWWSEALARELLANR